MDDVNLQIKLLNDEMDELDPQDFPTYREYTHKKNDLNIQLNKLQQQKSLSFDE